MKKTYIIFSLVIVSLLSICVFLGSNFELSKLAASVTINSNTYGKIHFIDVSNGHNVTGDAIVLESKGHLCLIDTGNPTKLVSKYDGKTYNYPDADGVKVANYIKNEIGGSTLDCVIITHNHTDHIGGFKSIVDSGLIDSSTNIYYRDFDDNTDAYKADNVEYYSIMVNSASATGAKLNNVNNNQNVNITVGNFNIRLLNTESWDNRGHTGVTNRENNNSIIEYVTIGTKKVLLSADMETVDELRLVNAGAIGKVDILKLGHHGEYTSSSFEYLDATNPDTIIVSGNVDYYPQGMNYPAINYLMNKKNKPVYFSSKVQDAIVVNFSSNNSYTVKNSDGVTDINNAKPVYVTKKSGIWTKVGQEKESRYAWYVLDSDGKSVTVNNWKEYDGYWYFFHFGNGAMVTSWKTYNDYDYFLNDGSIANFPEGAAVSGWQKINGYWYYFTPTKMGSYPEYSALSGFQTIDEKNYYFDSSHKMLTGWNKIDGLWYYMNPTKTSGADEGEILTGWQKIDGYWYFFDTGSSPIGKMMTGIKLLSNKLYYFYLPSEGSQLEGKMLTNGTRYGFTFGADGAATNYEGRITKPTAANYCKSITYNGANQTITNAAPAGVTFTGTSHKDAGSYTITAKLSTGYIWSDLSTANVTFKCSISKKSISDSVVTISNQYYTGSALTPAPTVKSGSTTLVKGTDYTISYSNNTNVGTASYTITGMGNYSGSKTGSFKIISKSIELIDTTNMNITNNKLYIKLKSGISIDKNTLFNNIKNSSTVKLYNGTSEITSSSALVALGYKLKAGTLEYPIVVYGDVDASGTVNSKDLRIIYINSLTNTLSGLKFEAADYDNSGTINSMDLRSVYIIINRRTE